MLTENDLARYGRQILYPGFGDKGQKRLKEAHVVVAGLGGLGCAASTYLACAGIGHLTIADDDLVQLSNLNRQILYWEEDIGGKKPLTAAHKLAKLNSSIKITPRFERITENNARDIIKGADLVIDGMDNPETRFVLNSVCVAERIPFIHGGINGLRGRVTTIIPQKTPCLACIFPVVPKREMVIPAFGVTPALIAILQVAEAIKLLANFGDLLAGRMLYVDITTMHFTIHNLSRDPKCKICGSKKDS